MIIDFRLPSHIYFILTKFTLRLRFGAIIVGNKLEIIPEFSLQITQFDFTKRGGRDEAGPSHCLETNRAVYGISDVVR